MPSRHELFSLSELLVEVVVEATKGCNNTYILAAFPSQRRKSVHLDRFSGFKMTKGLDENTAFLK